jgi:pyruvate formate lyase activating enzyme
MPGPASETRHPDGAREALLYEPRDDGSVVCILCAHRCKMKPGQLGKCRVRENRDGRLVTLVGDRIVSAAIDPIEKKPFYHFLPGSLSYSIATVGCNFHCRFCQNWSIAHWPRLEPGSFPGTPVTPQSIIRAAENGDCRSIAYTYTEPTVFFELALETCTLAAEAGIKNVFVTNGFLTAEALDLITPVLHAASVDLKSFRAEFYDELCRGQLEHVLNTIRDLRDRDIWLEVTTLIIPGQNDSDEELVQLSHWLAGVDRDIPWHVSAFFPDYEMTDLSPTPASILHRAARIGRQAGLRHVYTGNVPDDAWSDTACSGCGRILIRRCGYRVSENALSCGRCPGCGTGVAGVWDGLAR